MTISAAFQLGLEIYGLSRDPVSGRSEIWRILQPRMDAITDCYVEQLITHTPYYRELATTKNELLRRHIFRFAHTLFENPFDEQWVAETKERVEEEIELGLDMRNRCIVSQIILTELCLQLSKRHRFFRANTLRLIDIAVRVLLLDTTNAVALHYNAAVREAKGRSSQLSSAIHCFSEAIEGVRRAVSSAITALAEASNQVTNLATSASEQASKAASAADNTATNVSHMAAATEEMMASISEIRRQATTSATMAHEAVDNVHHATATINLLSESVGKIGSMTGLISKIADQTNLLALNATIEAASAGQAGKGFSVVATEVKTLASQTSNATKQIGEQIASIEQTTLRSVEEIAGTGRTIGSIAEMAESVATAVNEQTIASDSMARGISCAAEGATTVAAALKTVAETIRQTQTLAVSMLESSRQLSESTRQIDAAVDSLFRAAATQSGLDRIADLDKSATN